MTKDGFPDSVAAALGMAFATALVRVRRLAPTLTAKPPARGDPTALPSSPIQCRGSRRYGLSNRQSFPETPPVRPGKPTRALPRVGRQADSKRNIHRSNFVTFPRRS